MRRRIAFAALIAATLLSGGCGTFVNLVKPNDKGAVYGGVKNDVEVLGDLTGGGSPGGGGFLGSPSSSGNDLMALIALAVVILPIADIPLSLIADTLTLPYTLRQEKP